MLESEVVPQIERIMAEVAEQASQVRYPEIMRTLVDTSESVGHVLGLAQEAAAQREFTGEVLAGVRQKHALAVQMGKAVADRIDDVRDGNLSTQAQRLIGRGLAIDERRAEANLSVAERRVHLRAIEYRVGQIKAELDLVDETHRAWRDAEFGIDRLVRIMQLRHALGEV